MSDPLYLKYELWVLEMSIYFIFGKLPFFSLSRWTDNAGGLSFKFDVTRNLVT